jgi:hypothetical protein
MSTQDPNLLHIIDQTLDTSPLKSGFKSWVVNTWDPKSKILLYNRSQEELGKLQDFFYRHPNSDLHGVIKSHCWLLTHKYNYKPSYTCLLYCLIPNHTIKQGYFELYDDFENYYNKPKNGDQLQILPFGVVDFEIPNVEMFENGR